MTGLPERLVSDYLGGGYAKRTVKRYRSALGLFESWGGEHVADMLAVTRPDIEAFAKWLEASGYAANARYATLCAVRGLYRFAHKEGWLPSDPGKHVRLPARRRESNGTWLTKTEAETMGDTADRSPDPRVPALYWLLLLTGIRSMECANADVKDVEPYGDVRTLMVTRKSVGGEIYTQRIQLPSRVCSALDRMLGKRDSGPLFLGMTGKRISNDGMNRLLDKLTTEAGIGKQITAHSMRRSFATLALDAGVPPRDIMASGNWSAEEMLRFYDRERAAVDRHAGIKLAEWLEGGAS